MSSSEQAGDAATNGEDVSLATVARVHASLRAKAPLGETLGALKLTPDEWRDADERWTVRLVAAAEEDPTLLVAYDLALADAWDELAPRVEPYETDAAAWVALEEALVGNPEPLKALAVAGVELGDMPRLRRIWRRREEADASVAAALVEARRDPPILVRATRVHRRPAAQAPTRPIVVDAPVAPALSPPLATPPATAAAPVGSATSMAFELPSHLRQATMPFKKQDAPAAPAPKAAAAPLQKPDVHASPAPRVAAAQVGMGTAMSFELPANLRALPFGKDAPPPAPPPPPPPPPLTAANAAPVAPSPPVKSAVVGATAISFELPAHLRALPFPSPGPASPPRVTGPHAPQAQAAPPLPAAVTPPAPAPASPIVPRQQPVGMGTSMAFELPANLRATPFEAEAGPLVIGGMTLEQHAKLSAEVEGVPDPEPIFARFGFTDRARRAIAAAAWQERLARDPAARAQWMEIYQRARRR